MKLLINCPLNFGINNKLSNTLGGIETLNIELAKKFVLSDLDVTLASNCKVKKKVKNILNLPIHIIKKNSNNYHYDVIISSNDSTIFDYFPQSKKILWLHNPLQIEKSFRKKQFFSIIKNDINTVFVSDYLNKITSSLYLFKKRLVIPNFLPSIFTEKVIIKKRKPIFVWSVQREKGLNNTIEMWIKNINPLHINAKFYILGIDKLPNSLKPKYLKSKNIIHLGRVSKAKLRNIYTQSTAMICLGYDETFCLNAIEANSCGLPVISFGKTALIDLVKNNYNGFIVKDFKGLSKKIMYLLKSNNKIKLKFTNNCITYSKKFSLNSIFYAWLKLIK
jgi:glycosyltransferase involved in cell wall biosynthesis